MSDNHTQSTEESAVPRINDLDEIREKIARQPNNLDEEEVEFLLSCLEGMKEEKVREYNLALSGELHSKQNQAMSLAARTVMRTSDVELAAAVVYGSKAANKRSEVDGIELEMQRRKVDQWTAEHGWMPYHVTDSDDGDTDDDSDGNQVTSNDTSSDTAANSNRKDPSQRRRLNGVTSLSQLEPDAERKRSLRKDLFGK